MTIKSERARNTKQSEVIVTGIYFFKLLITERPRPSLRFFKI